MTINIGCEPRISHGCAQGKSIWVFPFGMCMGEAPEGVSEAHLWAQGNGKEKAWYQLMKGDNTKDKTTPLNLWTSHTLYLIAS